MYTNRIRALPSLLAISCIVFVSACDQFGSEESSGIHPVTTRFEKDDATAGKTGARNAACADGDLLCLTPSTLAGRVYSGGLMVGGIERPGYQITTIGANEEVRRRPDLGRTGTQTFDVARTTDFSGSYSCCGGTPYPPDEEALISRIEINFDYLDVVFTVPSSAADTLAGQKYVIRQVYVDETTASDVNGKMFMGDKLVRRSIESSFRWCNAEDCDHTTRPSDATIDPNLKPSRGGGNSHYAIFSIPLAGDATIPFTKEEALQGNWRFDVSFDLRDAAVFDFSDWSEAVSESALVNAFRLMHDSGASSASVRVRLSKHAGQGPGRLVDEEEEG